MTLLLIYLAIALVFSFLCSITEAVLLSVTPAYIRLLVKQGRKSGELLRKFKTDIEIPLAAILSLNTIAHTVGAAGVGAQSARVFGDASYMGLTSEVLTGLTYALVTLLILFFSEVIPKTLGSLHWRTLAPAVAWILKYLVIAMQPLVLICRRITALFRSRAEPSSFSRAEFSALADLGLEEGTLGEHEAQLLQNVLRLRNKRVEDVMTPSSVVFSLPASASVALFFNKHDKEPFTRIPVYGESPDDITGFVIRDDLLLAQARGNSQKLLAEYCRPLSAIPDKLPLLTVFERFLNQRVPLRYVVNEHGTFRGLLSLEDILEEMVGQEIIDETDRTRDMQKLARRRWRKKSQKLDPDTRPADSAGGDPAD